MQVAVYCRVSTEDQADAKTIENQVDFAAQFCSLHGYKVYNYYLDDGISGTISMDKRPSGFRLLEDASQGLFSAVCVYKLDRLARTALEILKVHQSLLEANIILKSMTENFDTSTPSGKFFMTTLGGIAEIERESIAERMRLGKKRALREGRWPGGTPPFGYYIFDKRLLINSSEAAVVKNIYRTYCDGGMSTGAIADYLNSIGVPSPGKSKGNKKEIKNGWHRSRIWSILTQPAYLGTFIFKTKEGNVELKCPAIIPENLWEKAQGILRNNFINSRRNAKRDYLLRGIIKCGICGRKFYGDGSGRPGRNNYYRCGGSTLTKKNHHRCRVKSVRADIIEKLVWDDIVGFLLRIDLSKELMSVGCRSGEYGSAALELENISLAVDSKKVEKKRIIGLYRRQIISEEELKEELANIIRELESLNKRAVVLRQQTIGIKKAEDLNAHLHCRLETSSVPEKRELVKRLVDSISVNVEPSGVPKVTIKYNFNGQTDCVLTVETRGKYRLGLPKAIY